MRSERLSTEFGLPTLPNTMNMSSCLPASEELSRSSSFDELFAEHRSMVYGLALRILGTHEDAEDVTQEVFTKVWRGYCSFNHSCSPKTWIYRIALNTSIDHGRKPWRKMGSQSTVIPSNGDEGSEASWFISEETAERSLLAKEKVVTLSKAIRALRPHLKDVFVLKELEEMSYDEISSILGLSMGTISSRLNRARKALQDSLRAITGTREFAGAPA